MAKRRYKEEFLTVGFTKAVRNGEERPQCVLCGEAFKGNRGALRASYQVSLHIAKAKKPHSIGEQLIKPCLKDVCLCLG
ncbi:hypothetical protein KUCAC02_033531 [Chaenocephalus aceratus]|nr:hypothetical protein KUCAC02_033531 [Chaenocephalus aceratus]